MGMMELFKTVIMIQLFYAFAITLFVHTLPVEALDYVTSFSDITESINLEGTATEIQDSITAQTHIPVVEVGALVFFSGNILIDLILNFAFAIPQMVGLVFSGMILLINNTGASFPESISTIIQLFIGVVVTVLYFLGVIQLLLGVRTGRNVT